MKRYRLTPTGVHDTQTNGSTSENLENGQWLRYLKWKAEGNTPDPIAIREPDSNEIKLDKSDKQMIRAIDWLLQELVKNGTIKISDIPGPLKALYQTRKAQRGA